MPDRTRTETIRHDPATGLYFAWRGSHTVNVRHSPDGDDVYCFSFGYGPGNPELDVAGFHKHVDYWLRENTDEHGGAYKFAIEHGSSPEGARRQAALIAWCDERSAESTDAP